MTNKLVLCIQMAESSYDESYLIFRMYDQLGPHIHIHCMLNSVTAGFVSSQTDFVCTILNERLDDNLERFNTLVEKINYDYIVLLDLHKSQTLPWDLNFLPEWLQDTKVPILAFDYYNLMVNQDDDCALTPAIKPHEKASPIPFQPWLIKPSPPIQERQAQKKSFYWDVINPEQKIAQNMVRQQVIDTMGLTPETKIISVIIDPLLFQKALEANLISFFYVMQETLIFYMRAMENHNFHVFFCGVGPPEPVKRERYKDVNFQCHFFNYMTYDIYRTMMCSADLILTNSNMMFPLVDAMALETPVGIMGNSIGFQKKGEDERELMSVFKPDPFLYDMVKLMEELNKHSFKLPVFPFINYPLLEAMFPDTGPQFHVMPHVLLDFFDDLDTLPYLEQLIFDKDNKRQDYQRYAAGTLALNQNGLPMTHILDKITQEE